VSCGLARLYLVLPPGGGSGREQLSRCGAGEYPLSVATAYLADRV